MRLLVALLAGLVLRGGHAVEEPRPLPPVEPEAAPLIPVPAEGEVQRKPQARVDRVGLMGDLTALVKAKERVKRLLEAGDFSGPDGQQLRLIEERLKGDKQGAEGFHVPDGPAQRSRRLGDNLLEVQRWLDGATTVTARIAGEPVEVVYRELATLLDLSIDDSQVRSDRPSIAFNVSKLPWDEALSRLLGQVGIGWRHGAQDQEQPPAGDKERKAGGRSKLVFYEIEAGQGDVEDLERQAVAAYRDAARRFPDGPYAAEALYRLSRHDHDRGRSLVALQGYLDLLDRFNDLSPESPNFPAVQPWMREALLGAAQAFTDRAQHRDSRNMYLSYIASSSDSDPRLPEVYLAAAEQGLEVARLENDSSARLQARDLMETLLFKFGKKEGARRLVERTQLNLGRLLFDEGATDPRRYADAKAYLLDHEKMVGEKVGDQVRYWLAECEYQQGLAERDLGNLISSESHMTAARTRFQDLADRLRHGAPDPLAEEPIYREALYKVGLTYVHQPKPDFVRALFAFLRARQRYPEEQLPLELLIYIARCYAELQGHEQAVAALQDLLKTDSLTDDSDAQKRLEALLADVDISLKAYRGGLKAKVLFYIAQGRFRAAQGSPHGVDDLLKGAIHAYQRVIDERPGSELTTAARLGLARAAFQRGDDEQAESILKEVLRDRSAAGRDREFAAKLLGGYYRKQKRFDEAIRAFSGQVAE